MTRYFVRRGGEWAKVQNAKLRPGETVFVKRENGEMGKPLAETIGLTWRTAATGNHTMTFKLLKKATGPVLTKFHVTDSAGSIVGSINVANEQAADLQKQWREPGAPAAAASPHARAVNAISAALKRGPRLSREATRQAMLRS